MPKTDILLCMKIHLESFPLKFRKEMLAFLGQFISRSLKEKGVTEEKILAAFKTFKKTRHRPNKVL